MTSSLSYRDIILLFNQEIKNNNKDRVIKFSQMLEPVEVKKWINPLAIAMRSNADPEIIEILLDNGYHPSDMTNMNMTCIELILMGGSIFNIEIFIKLLKMCDINKDIRFDDFFFTIKKFKLIKEVIKAGYNVKDKNLKKFCSLKINIMDQTSPPLYLPKEVEYLRFITMNSGIIRAEDALVALRGDMSESPLKQLDIYLLAHILYHAFDLDFVEGYNILKKIHF